ncbi:hypothetical protein E5AUHO_23210 [Citrobacter freundii]|nr:hypothetical protein E5AUHO_23210 [Citrobacter freundii]
MTLDSIKNALFAAMHGMTPEEYTLQKARENLASVTSGFLRKNPEYLRGRFGEGKPANGLECLKAPTDSPVNKTTDKKSNKTKIIKMLGADAGVFKPHDIDPDALERAKVACRRLVADDPERYGHIIKPLGVE